MPYNRPLGFIVALSILAAGAYFWARNSNQRLGIPCRDPLDSWRSDYVVKEESAPQGTFRVLYKTRRLGVAKNGTVCDCDFKDDPPRPLVARAGHLTDSHTFKWEKFWTAGEKPPTAGGPTKIVTVWKDGALVKPLLIEEENGCPAAIPLVRDAVMPVHQVCACFGLTKMKQPAPPAPQGFSQF